MAGRELKCTLRFAKEDAEVKRSIDIVSYFLLMAQIGEYNRIDVIGNLFIL